MVVETPSVVAQKPVMDTKQRASATRIETQAGMIPRDWEAIQLGDLFLFKNGLNKSKEYFGSGTPIVNYMDVFRRPWIRFSELEGRVSLSHSEIQRYAVQKGDVFFTRTSETAAEIGTASVLLDDAPDTVFSGFILRARPKNSYLDDDFKKYCFAAKKVRDQIVSTTIETTRALTSGRILSRVWIARPPIDEQRAIASILSDADALTESFDKLVAKKRAVKLATMQQLLTGKRRMSGFTKPWEHKLLGEIGEFAKGQGIKVDDITDDGVACIRYGELYTRYRNYFTRAVSRIPSTVAAQALRIRKGDLLFPGSGETAEEIGMCAAYLGEEDAYAGGDVIVFSPRAQDPVFLAHLLNFSSVARQKARLSHGEVIVHINARSLRTVQLDIPDLSEQEAIAKVFVNMDQEISRLEQRREKVAAMKQGMMQALLTGKVRLVEPEVNA